MKFIPCFHCRPHHDTSHSILETQTWWYLSLAVLSRLACPLKPHRGYPPNICNKAKSLWLAPHWSALLDVPVSENHATNSGHYYPSPSPSMGFLGLFFFLVYTSSPDHFYLLLLRCRVCVPLSSPFASSLKAKQGHSLLSINNISCLLCHLLKRAFTPWTV